MIGHHLVSGVVPVFLALRQIGMTGLHGRTLDERPKEGGFPTPFSPPSDPALRRLQGPSTKSRPLVDDDGGRGDRHHSIYAGLNYHFSDDNLKVMGGIEFSDLQTRTGDLTTWTYLIGFRSYF